MPPEGSEKGFELKRATLLHGLKKVGSWKIGGVHGGIPRAIQ